MLLVLGGVAGVIWNVMAGGSDTDRGNRAQTWGTILATVMIVPPVLIRTRRPLTQPEPPQVVTAGQRASAAEHLAVQASRFWGEQVRRRLDDAASSYSWVGVTARELPPLCHRSHHAMVNTARVRGDQVSDDAEANCRELTA